MLVNIPQLYTSKENNSTESINETLNNTTCKNDEQAFYDDPFKNLDLEMLYG